MERLTKRSVVFAGALMAAGAAIQLTPRISLAAGKTEPQLEQMAPTRIGGYKLVHSYKMDARTYSELKPFGIVSRIFQEGERSFDVVLIASNRKESFHDPRLCFTSQGWTLQDESQVVLQTARGPIPVTIAKMKSIDGSPQITAFFYRGPGGYFSTSQSFAFDSLKRQFTGSIDLEGVFYRFIPLWSGATVEDLEAFIGAYLDEAAKTSGGYF